MPCLLSFSTPDLQDGFPFEKKELEKLFSTILALLSEDFLYRETRMLLGKGVARIGVLVCNDQEMRHFNKTYRNIDRTTDVLSFPSKELGLETLKLMPQSELSLGDLIFSKPALERGAKRGRRSLKLEFLEVFIHGCLHLIGYDHVRGNAHVSPRLAKKMRMLQKTLFLSLKATI